MLQWSLETKTLPLKFVWKISRGALLEKTSYFVRLRSPDGISTFGEVAPNQRYGNTPEVIQKDFQTFLAQALDRADLQGMSVSEFNTWLDALKLCKTLRFGVESAWLNLKAQEHRTTIAALAGLPSVTQVPTSFSVPIMEAGELEAFIRPLSRFKSLKIKVDAATGVETIREVSRVTSQPLRIDGNEDWNTADELMRFVETLKNKNIEFLEQPMPSHLCEAYREVLPRMPFPLIADESIEDRADFDDLKTQFSGVNIKLMKTGGLLRAAELLQEARVRGFKTMVGCMVETSLGISAAMHLGALFDYGDLDGFLLLKDDPFKLLREENGDLYFN